ncbi:MAG: cytochrome C oxidase subunit IV family protein [Bryobacteraceae bacterium]
MTHQVVPVRIYVTIWLVLIVLTFTTWGVAYIDMGSFNIVVAITIAVIKMLLVIIWFMHVKQADNLTRLFVVAGFFWMAILIFVTLSDYHSRDWLPLPHMW